MNSSNGKSQLELFEEALKGLTSKDDDHIPQGPTSTSSESKESQRNQPAPDQHVETHNTECKPSSKRYFLVTRSSLSKLRSSLATSKSVSVIGKATITAQSNLSSVTCTNTQGFSPNWQSSNQYDCENEQQGATQEQRYDLKAACEREWLGRTFRPPRKRRRITKPADQRGRKRKYKLVWNNLCLLFQTV